jgi:hypothetical protein
LYARWEGKLVRALTSEQLDANQFDSSNPASKTWLFGERYFDVGFGPETMSMTQATGLEPLSRNGLNAKLFFSVSPAVGSSSVYVGFQDPRARGARSCTIYPVYLSSKGLVPGEKITLTPQRPYAWLRRFRLNADGSTTIGTLPRDDDEFKRDLVEFSKRQSQLLCEKTQRKRATPLTLIAPRWCRCRPVPRPLQTN